MSSYLNKIWHILDKIDRNEELAWNEKIFWEIIKAIKQKKEQQILIDTNKRESLKNELLKEYDVLYKSKNFNFVNFFIYSPFARFAFCLIPVLIFNFILISNIFPGSILNISYDTVRHSSIYDNLEKESPVMRATEDSGWTMSFWASNASRSAKIKESPAAKNVSPMSYNVEQEDIKTDSINDDTGISSNSIDNSKWMRFAPESINSALKSDSFEEKTYLKVLFAFIIISILFAFLISMLFKYLLIFLYKRKNNRK